MKRIGKAAKSPQAKELEKKMMRKAEDPETRAKHSKHSRSSGRSTEGSAGLRSPPPPIRWRICAPRHPSRGTVSSWEPGDDETKGNSGWFSLGR
jgi:hypothetical protein